MHHYVYYSYEEWGRGYIGVRSCHCSPDQDIYFGSYRDKTFSPTEKIIISEFESRQEAEKAEKTLQEFFSVVKNPHFANQAINLLVGFSRLGAKATPEQREKTRLANLGDKNPNYGKPRSLATRKKQSASLKGRKFRAETLEKMRNSQKKNRKPLVLEHVGSGAAYKFESINEAATALGLNVGNVSNVYTGRQKTTNGFRLKSK